MNLRTLNHNYSVSKQRGSAALWALLGLLGFAALAWFCLARHVPVLEQRIQTSVLNAIGPAHASNVSVEMNGYTANISGAVPNSTVKDDIIAAAGSALGVRAVNDNLQVAASPVTANVDDNNEAAEQTAPSKSESATEAETETEKEAETVAPESGTDAAPKDAPQEATDSETNEPPEATDTEAPSESVVTTAPEPTTATTATAATAEAPAATPDTQEQSAANNESIAPASGDSAELNIAVNDRTVTLTGRVQDQRELRPIVEAVMTTFDLNYVTNDTNASDEIAPMTWMDGLVTSVADLENIKNPSIDVFNQQITLAGTIDSAADQQSIIETLRKNLPDFSLVDRLRVLDSGAIEPTTTEQNPAQDTTQNTTTAEPAENTVEETVEETVETSETNDQTDAAATESAALEAKRQAEIEEEFRIAARERERAEQERAEAAAQAEAEAKAAAEAEAKRAADAAAEAAAKAEAEAQAAAEAAEAAKQEIDPVAEASQNLTAAFASLPDTRILFRSGSDEFTEDSVDRLDDIVNLLNEYPIVPVAIKGHTDSQGDEAANLALSQLRANAVRDYLVSQGISVFRLSSFGYGESLPIATNDTPDGRAANRRIEFSF